MKDPSNPLGERIEAALKAAGFVEASPGRAGYLLQNEGWSGWLLTWSSGEGETLDDELSWHTPEGAAAAEEYATVLHAAGIKCSYFPDTGHGDGYCVQLSSRENMSSEPLTVVSEQADPAPEADPQPLPLDKITEQIALAMRWYGTKTALIAIAEGMTQAAADGSFSEMHSICATAIRSIARLL